MSNQIAYCPNCLRATYQEPYQSELFDDEVSRCTNCLIIRDSVQTTLSSHSE